MKIDKLNKYFLNKVLPLVYDESLSYYEMLCKLREKINELIDNFETIQEEFEEIKEHEEAQDTDIVNIKAKDEEQDGKIENLELEIVGTIGDVDHILNYEIPNIKAKDNEQDIAINNKIDKSQIVQVTGDSETDIISQKKVSELVDNLEQSVLGVWGDVGTIETVLLPQKIDKSQIEQNIGSSENNVMSQKAITQELTSKVNKAQIVQQLINSNDLIPSSALFYRIYNEIIANIENKINELENKYVPKEAFNNFNLLQFNYKRIGYVYGSNSATPAVGDPVSIYEDSTKTYIKVYLTVGIYVLDCPVRFITNESEVIRVSNRQTLSHRISITTDGYYYFTLYNEDRSDWRLYLEDIGDDSIVPKYDEYWLRTIAQDIGQSPNVPMSQKACTDNFDII